MHTDHPLRRPDQLVAAITAALLVACGGSDDDEPTPTTPDSAAPAAIAAHTDGRGPACVRPCSAAASDASH